MNPDYERYEAVRSCRYVDYIIPAASLGPFNEKFMDYFKFDFMAHETSNTERYAEIKVCCPFIYRLTTVGLG